MLRSTGKSTPDTLEDKNNRDRTNIYNKRIEKEIKNLKESKLIDNENVYITFNHVDQVDQYNDTCNSGDIKKNRYFYFLQTFNEKYFLNETFFLNNFKYHLNIIKTNNSISHINKGENNFVNYAELGKYNLCKDMLCPFFSLYDTLNFEVVFNNFPSFLNEISYFLEFFEIFKNGFVKEQNVFNSLENNQQGENISSKVDKKIVAQKKNGKIKNYSNLLYSINNCECINQDVIFYKFFYTYKKLKRKDLQVKDVENSSIRYEKKKRYEYYVYLFFLLFIFLLPLVIKNVYIHQTYEISNYLIDAKESYFASEDVKQMSHIKKHPLFYAYINALNFVSSHSGVDTENVRKNGEFDGKDELNWIADRESNKTEGNGGERDGNEHHGSAIPREKYPVKSNLLILMLLAISEFLLFSLGVIYNLQLLRKRHFKKGFHFYNSYFDTTENIFMYYKTPLKFDKTTSTSTSPNNSINSHIIIF
ncbi:conserved Plasmodium protein, unknown function [Plasmodium ovale wallikeri]|uniref:Uncharacterized protein n=1 Tax=Plasmodium ovale wallikeri TaxID=864142 RepID=A0A1A8ZR91_PLAOA|nr:conserved Plasmodium protein, unknown function [Plasmodium ovale wallikeri]SBT46380.1 conserved Plasmodium protein, unknown function [Plasmodium ovale wallikeri]